MTKIPINTAKNTKIPISNVKNTKIPKNAQYIVKSSG